MKATLQQISAMTGFSTATVSNALHSKKGVNANTAAAVLAAAQKLGYFNNTKITAVRFVQYQCSGRIVSETPFFAALYEGIEAECRARGYEAMATILEKDNPDTPQRLEQILNNTTCGVILLSTEAEEADMAYFATAKAPLLLLDNWPENTDCSALLINNTDSVCSAVEYLIANGHTQIGYLKCTERIKNFFYRQEGYLRALHRHGLTADPCFTVDLPPDTVDAWPAMEAYLATNPALPTAFFADNDAIALGAMKAFEAKGIRVPQQISIIGFDDMPFAAFSTPPLTTIRVPKIEMGRLAVRLLLESTDATLPVATKTQVCTQLVLRNSVQAL